MKRNYTIKDIARMAGVSAGTVDRVLHNRGDVSKTSKEKVQKVLEEIDYHPNMFAIGLAAKRRYTIICLIPYYIEQDYWHSIVLGIERAAEEYQPLNVNIQYIHYKHGDETSYKEACNKLYDMQMDAVLIAPIYKETTLSLLNALNEHQIPYAFIDHNIKDTNALIYIGQDSYESGYIAAKLLMNDYADSKEIVLFLNSSRNDQTELQMQRRLDGFMNHIAMECDKVIIHDVILNKEDPQGNKETLDSFFESHPNVTLGAIFNSRVYQVGEYFKYSGRRLKSLVGYDLLNRNIELLKTGEVKYLIGQRPGLQGYYGIKTLSEYIMLKKSVHPVKYMPIDILMKENIDYYFEFQ